MHALFEIFIRKVFVPGKCVRIRVLGIDLNRSLEKLQSRLVLLLQRETIAENAPSLRRQAIELLHLLRQVRELHLLLQVPQHRRVHIHSF